MVFSDRPGEGNMGKFLDSLPRDRRVVFPTVVNSVLEGMLARRGFARGTEVYQGDLYEIMERLPHETNETQVSI